MATVVQVIITATETPQGLRIGVEGPENPILLLGLIELGKDRALSTMSNPAPRPHLVVPPPGLKVPRNGG